MLEREVLSGTDNVNVRNGLNAETTTEVDIVNGVEQEIGM